MNDRAEDMAELMTLLKNMRAAEQNIPATFAGLARTMPPAKDVIDGKYTQVETFQIIQGVMEQLEQAALDFLESTRAVKGFVDRTLGYKFDRIDTGYKWVPGEDS